MTDQSIKKLFIIVFSVLLLDQIYRETLSSLEGFISLVLKILWHQDAELMFPMILLAISIPCLCPKKCQPAQTFKIFIF